MEKKINLKPEDFQNQFFDRQKPTQRMVGKRLAIEGVTITDNFVKIGFTCFLDNGELSLVNENNENLFSGTITCSDDFEKALKKAEKKHKTLRISK
ncbi:MAG: hypothetical protein AB1333_02600 [Patescibacteria group bacterium]